MREESGTAGTNGMSTASGTVRTSDASGTAAERPNIVVFLADDLGWGDLGCFGATKIPTPNIDALAAHGVRFTDCHASSAVCTPSRYSVLTGDYPWRSPLQSGVLGGTDPCILAPGQQTLPRVLRAHGYRTGAFGKWHLGMDWRTRDGRRPSAFDTAGFVSDMQASGREIDYSAPVTNGPVEAGFERFFGIAGSLDMPPYCFIDQDRTLGIPDVEKTDLVTSQRPGLQVVGWRDDQTDLEFTRTARTWIAEQAAAGESFFAYIASAAPHRPCVPPELVRGRSDAGARGDAVCLVDWMVGEVLAELERSGALEKTIIIVTSDNGAPMIFPEDGDVVEHRPNGAWRGQKADAWEGGHRVPLVVCGPGLAGGGREVEETVSLLDLFPTVAELVGAWPEGVAPEASAGPVRSADGSSFARLLTCEHSAAEGARRVLGQQAFDGSLALREGSRKAIFSSGSGGFSEPVGVPVTEDSDDGQFYDLALDPRETQNRWARSRSTAAEMLDRFRDATGFPGGARASGTTGGSDATDEG